MVQHRVILDLNPNEQYLIDPRWMDLDLHKNGEWWCSYQGFLDHFQLDEIRAEFQLTVNPVDPKFLEGLRENGFNLEER
jgi:hypothetical protein